MENASKALLIAAAAMISMMVLSALLIMYNQISNYFQEKQNSVYTEQVVEFNSRFTGYNRKNIRGSDLISLMNKVIDYNERETYAEGTNYKRIEVTIKIDNKYIEDFKYSDSSFLTSPQTVILPEITNTKGNGTNREKDKQLIAITSLENELIKEANAVGIYGLNTKKLESLSSNIGNIIINETSDSDYDRTNREKRAKLLKSILEVDVSTDAKIKAIKTITYKYYQYTQFKRAHFDCIEFVYDNETGRVCEMNFQVSTKNGSVVFN